MIDGELTHQSPATVDFDVAVAQHEAYVALLRDCGYGVLDAPPLDDHPDGVFVEDTVIVIGDAIVLTRPGAESRRREVDSMEPIVGGLGGAVRHIAPAATLDGGDVLVTDRHVFVGLSTRTNRAAVDQLAPIAAGEGRVAVGVAVTQCLHLKTAITGLPDGSLVGGQGLIDTAPFRALGYRVHTTDEPLGANVLCLGDTVVVSADAPGTAEQLAREGFDVRQIAIGEFHKLEAGLTCMSVLIDGDAPLDE